MILDLSPSTYHVTLVTCSLGFFHNLMLSFFGLSGLNWPLRYNLTLGLSSTASINYALLALFILE